MKQDQVIFRLPGETNFHQWQGNISRYNHADLEQYIQKDCYLIKPFDGEYIYILHPTKKIILNSDELKKLKLEQATQPAKSMKNMSRSDYLSLLDQTIKNIKNGLAEKIVIARNYTEQFENHDSIIQSIQKLGSNYTQALICYLQSDALGYWIGASPEIIFKQDFTGWETVALAGTKLSNNQTDWGTKEKLEHQKVMHYIENILNTFELNFESSDMKTIHMGHLQHLYIKYSSTQQLDSKIASALIHALSPTPAVCGTPMKIAKDYILQNEGFSRALYTGYWGPLIDQNMHLYVNLRCCQLHSNSITYFAGGGINSMSDAAAEWVETEEKISLLKNVMNT